MYAVCMLCLSEFCSPRGKRSADAGSTAEKPKPNVASESRYARDMTARKSTKTRIKPSKEFRKYKPEEQKTNARSTMIVRS